MFRIAGFGVVSPGEGLSISWTNYLNHRTGRFLEAPGTGVRLKYRRRRGPDEPHQNNLTGSQLTRTECKASSLGSSGCRCESRSGDAQLRSKEAAPRFA